MTKLNERNKPGTKREGILDAAEKLVMDLGAAHLTMDLVAAHSQVSKGGVLHHFPTKIDLIKAMLERLLAAFENDMAMIERVAGPDLKDHLRAWVRLMQTTDEKLDRLSAALLSASANDPELLKPFASLMQRRSERYRDNSANFGPALVILTALDGYWLFNALEISSVQPFEQETFFNALNQLIDNIGPTTESAKR